jgi:hypothetical protein
LRSDALEVFALAVTELRRVTVIRSLLATTRHNTPGFDAHCAAAAFGVRRERGELGSDAVRSLNKVARQLLGTLGSNSLFALNFASAVAPCSAAFTTTTV